MNYFDDALSKHFSFESFASDLDDTTFAVVNFTGYEAISKPYDFEIMLLSSNKEIDLEDILQAQAVFTIHRGGDDDVLYNGIISEFDQLHEVNDVIFYRARLVPKLWWLTLTHHNQVFLDQSVPDIVEDALRDGGMESTDFDISGLSGYEELSYSCQYDESHFNYVSRILERQGIYYYFSQDSDGEVLVMTDTKFSHESLKEGAELFYNPASGLEGHHLAEAIGSFTCRQKQIPAEIILKDYNYEKPSLDITSTAVVDEAGRGTSYLYGEYFATPEEGERFAGIRAEELLCQKQEFYGESTVPYMMPGFSFNLNNHYREDFNQEYLVVEVTHEGNQSHMLSAGIATEDDRAQHQSIYKNSFKVIPNETQYRPQRITKKPKISGTIHAKIDSEVDGEYAQIDEQGRYRVKLPFDINDEHMDGKGSAPVRMMQSYAGKDRGMQFPLVKDTEVLLTFIEGNPDRPVIAGAVSNPETRGPVSAENLSESVIQTGSDNKIRFEDVAGSERIIMESPTSKSWFRIGAPNDPLGDLDSDQAPEVEYASDGIRINTVGSLWTEAAEVYGDYLSGAPKNSSVNMSHIDYTPNTSVSAMLALFDQQDNYQPSGLLTRHGGTTEILSTALNKAQIKVSSLDTFTTQEGNIYDFGGYWNYNLGNSYVENHIDQSAVLNQSQDAAKTITDTYNAELDVLKDELAVLKAADAVLDAAYAFEENPLYSGLDIDGDGDTNVDAQKQGSLDAIAAKELEIKNKKLAKPLVPVHDLLNQGGPGWSSINWPTATGKISASDTELDGPFYETGSDTPPAQPGMAVDKSFGNSYDYKNGDAIGVTVGSSLDVQHGGRHVEVKYRGDGSIASWSKSESGETDEKKWTSEGILVYETSSAVTPLGSFGTENKYDSRTGVLYANSGENGTGMSRSSFNFDFSANASMNINAGAQTETGIYLLVKNSNSVFVGGEINVSAYAGFSASLSLCAALKVDSEFAATGIFKNENTEWSLSTMGNKIKGTTTKLETAIANITTCASNIETIANTINNHPIKMSVVVVDITS